MKVLMAPLNQILRLMPLLNQPLDWLDDVMLFAAGLMHRRKNEFCVIVQKVFMASSFEIGSENMAVRFGGSLTYTSC